MWRGSVPRGSVGRAKLARDLEPGEVDESVPPKAAASVPWDPKEIGTKAKSPPPTHSPPADCSTIPTRSASAEAATEVGAALPAEDTRTYCEGCLEANQVRAQWNTEFDATVQCNEEEAADYGNRLPKRQKLSQELRVEIPTAAFMCGQPVLQWWASWMKDAPDTPSHYNKKSRPAWFSAEVLSYCGYGHIKYAGQTMLAHQYHVY